MLNENTRSQLRLIRHKINTLLEMSLEKADQQEVLDWVDVLVEKLEKAY